MNKYTLGETYRKACIDTATELVPQNPAFKTFPGEKHCFDEREGHISFFSVMKAIESGVLTELDKSMLSLVATFGSACMTSKVLKELLTMMGVSYSANSFDSALKRLHKHQLVNFSRFLLENREPANTRIITLTNYGSQLAKSFGVYHRFNSFATASAEAHTVKSRAQTAHLISNYLKNRIADGFEVRPVIVVDAENSKIVRPAASIKVLDEKIYFEVPRRHEGWLEDLLDKVHRYELVFDGKPAPTVIINGEDEGMNREIAASIAKLNLPMEILYTDDLAMFGPKFRWSIYGFADDGTKQCYELLAQEDAVA